MKRYAPALGAVLRVRQAQESMARAALQQANTAAHSAELATEKAYAHYEEVSSAAGPLLAQHEMAGLAAKAVADARREAAEKKAETARATGSYLDASKALSAVLHVEERRREEHALAEQQEEQSLSDELALSRYGRRKNHWRKQGPAS